jgi:hypothetical protein
LTSETCKPGVDLGRAVAQAPDAAPAVLAGLVLDVADDLLHDVAERHQAGRAAVLVEHDRDLDLLALELGQELGEALGLGHEVGRAQDRRSGRAAGPSRPRRARRRARVTMPRIVSRLPS